MADERVLEGRALRRAVAEAQGWWVAVLYRDFKYYLLKWELPYAIVGEDGDTDEDAWNEALRLHHIPDYDTDLNTIIAADAVLPDDAWVSVTIFPRGADTWARAECVNPEAASGIVHHDEPATAAWNAVLRWLAARKQEAGDESVK